MAHFDPASGQLVLQIVYDGAAFSGKTASIESLSRLLQQEVVSPEVEDGRTLLFDWMQYEGGVRFGRPILCRVITVPGQKELAYRRKRLIREADGIIFVADSRRGQFGRSVEHWHKLREEMADGELDAALTVQLNHRDSESVVTTEEVRRTFDLDWSDRLIDSVATHDRGTREAFVITVGETLRHHVAERTLDRLKSKSMQDAPASMPIHSPEKLAQRVGAEDMSWLDE